MEEEFKVISSDRGEGIAMDSGARVKKLTIVVIIIAACMVAVGIFARQYYLGDKGTYLMADGIYKNRKLGFQLNVPASWKTYSVQEAVACPTIRREYADDYYLIKSPTANYNETGFIIDKEALPANYFTSSPLDYVRAQFRGKDPALFEMALSQNPDIMEGQRKYEADIAQYKVLDINGITVYRKLYEIAGGTVREDNYFVVGGSLMNIYYYASLAGDESARVMEEMREVIDKTLAKS